MHSNNVVGTVQPIEEVVGVLEERREGSIFPIFHTDAAQSIGKVEERREHLIYPLSHNLPLIIDTI